MRTRYRYDKDLGEVIEIRPQSNYFEEKTESTNVISDDVGAGVNGLRHMPSGRMLDSKSAHRRETKARGLEEVGNDRMASQRPKAHPDDYMRQVLKADQQIKSNWNGTRDWLNRQNEQKPR